MSTFSAPTLSSRSDLPAHGELFFGAGSSTSNFRCTLHELQAACAGRIALARVGEEADPGLSKVAAACAVGAPGAAVGAPSGSLPSTSQTTAITMAVASGTFPVHVTGPGVHVGGAGTVAGGLEPGSTTKIAAEPPVPPGPKASPLTSHLMARWRRPRFIVDSMMGRLARWLRIIGECGATMEGVGAVGSRGVQALLKWPCSPRP